MQEVTTRTLNHGYRQSGQLGALIIWKLVGVYKGCSGFNAPYQAHVLLFSSLDNPELTGAHILIQQVFGPLVIDWVFLKLSSPNVFFVFGLLQNR